MRVYLPRRAVSCTVIGLQSEALCFLVPYRSLALPPRGRAGLGLSRVPLSAHGYRAAPGCVFSLGCPYIAPLTAALGLTLIQELLRLRTHLLSGLTR